MNFKKIFIRFRTSNNDISINELKELLRLNSNTMLLDVRSNKEFNEYHLNNAINIPLYELEANCKCRIKDKEKQIIVYCQSGIRSKKALRILYKKGFKNLYNLKGGLDEI